MNDYQTITIEGHDDVLLAVVRTRRLDSATALTLEDEVSRAAIEQPRLPVVIDLFSVKFAPSVALGVLVNLFKGFKVAGRRAFLIGANSQIRGTLSVTGLDALIDVRESLDAVLADC